MIETSLHFGSDGVHLVIDGVPALAGQIVQAFCAPKTPLGFCRPEVWVVDGSVVRCYRSRYFRFLREHQFIERIQRGS